jgi:hypothetical protein
MGGGRGIQDSPVIRKSLNPLVKRLVATGAKNLVSAELHTFEDTDFRRQ